MKNRNSLTGTVHHRFECHSVTTQFISEHVSRHDSYVKPFQSLTRSAYKETTLTSPCGTTPSPAPSPRSTSDLFIVLTW